MATTIKLKNGSGAPLAGDLVQGEPALDLTNKRLYTEDSGGTVIEVGTNPTSLTTGTFTSTGIDDNATSTAITIDSSENVGIGKAPESWGNTWTALDVSYGASLASYNSGGFPNTWIVANGYNDNTDWRAMDTDQSCAIDLLATTGTIRFLNTTTNTTAGNAFTWNETMRIDSSGNLGVGTTSPSSYYADNLVVAAPDQGGITIAASSTSDANYLMFADGTVGNAAYRGYIGFQHDAPDALNILSHGFVRFYTGPTTPERMRIDSNGNVGIGTSSPSTYDSRANNLVVGDSGDAGVTIFSGATSNARLQFAPSSDTGLNNGLIDYDNNDDSMAFATGGSERMRINSSGNVSIGTTSPAAKLHINGTGDLIRLTSTNSSSGGAQIDLMHFSPSPANGDIHSYINFGGYYSGTSQAYGSSIRGVWNGVGAREGQIHFYTRKGDSFTEKMRLDEDGNVLVGTTTAVGTGDEGVQIGPNVIITGRDQTSDQIHHIFKNPNGTVGTIRTLNSATSYVTSSDARLKENIVDAPAGNIDAIRVRSFDWKADGSHQTYGMVAQELVDVAPEAVSQGETEDDMWGVDYSKLVPMMIKEIQDLKAEVAALKGA